MDAVRSALSDSNNIISNSNGAASTVLRPPTPTPSPPARTPPTRPPSSASPTTSSPSSPPERGGFNFFADAKIALGDGREVPVHRCILSARSGFFRGAFTRGETKLEVKELGKDYEIGHDSLMVVLGYLYSGKVKPPPPAVHECVDEGGFRGRGMMNSTYFFRERGGWRVNGRIYLGLT